MKVMKKSVIFILSILFAVVGNAQQISEEEALLKAQKFLSGKTITKSTKLKSARRAQQMENEPYYVFNAENNGGFVIVSGDERTEEILGYSNSGNIDLDNLPPNLKGWLENYSKQIKALDASGVTDRSASKRSPKAAISPLLSTRWGQDDPYNMKCPDFFSTGNKCFTGCIATAMAQIMYYHRAKSTNKTITTIPGYNTKSIWFGFEEETITIGAIPEGSIIDWDNMLDSYNGLETDVQKEAVANLMLYCGASVNMDYARAGAGSSAIPSDIPVALINYFDYSENSTLVWRQNYTEADWDELIYSELRKGNPLYYGGYNSSSGHAFVCDGYDGSGYYHINWGWDGLSDSFFLLSALNPAQQGIGGSSAGYNEGQCALIGAVPNGKILRLTSRNVSLTGNTSFKLSEAGENITVPVRWGIQNMTGSSCNFDHAIGLYYNGELVKVLKETGTSEMFNANQEKTIDASLAIETNLSSGIYQLYALNRSQYEEKWFRNENSSDCYITLVIKDGSMSFYIGKPAAAENVINFADDEVKRICVENWDTDGDGEISYDEAAAVTDFGYVFERSNIKTFDEAQYFTGITSFGLTRVNGSAFEDGYSCSSLVSIKIPSSVTSIREGGFYGCKAMTSIDIPASVKEIGENAFQACFALHEVSLHEGLERISDGAFYKCGFNSITIPASVSLIGKYVWGHCPNLIDIYVDDKNPYYCSINGVLFTKDQKNLVAFPCKRDGIYNIPIGTEAICPRAFYSSELEGIVFPESLKSLGDQAFQFMEKLKAFTIPSTITTIGDGVFWGCFNLKDVAIEGNRFEIPEGMFYNCSSLNGIHLPEDIISIGAHAFELNGKLTEITIPSKVTYIGELAFAYTDLRRVTSLMETPCAISSTVFEDTNVNPILYVPEQSIAAYKEAENWKNFSQILPINQNSVEPYAELNNGVLTFYNDNNRNARSGVVYEIPYASDYTSSLAQWTDKNSTITKIIFDASFADARPTITQAWFDGCEILTEIQGIENLNTSEVTTMSTMFQGCHSLTSIDLSNFKTGKATSMHGMFWGCSKLKTVILPDDLAFIDSYQFVYCSSLTDISIPASVKSIGERAFNYCTSLEEITIPAKVTSIGDNAFSYSGLKKITSLMPTPCSIRYTVFEEVYNNATLCVPQGCMAVYEAADYWKDFKKITGPSYNLIYLVDGENYKTVDYEEGAQITPEAAPTKEGYAFSGWSEIPATMPANDVTVTGTFTINKYKLTYMLDGVEYKSYEIEYGASITPEAEPGKEGYSFSGWGSIPATMPAQDVVVSGTFTKGAYKLIYQVDGTVYKTVSYDFGDAITAEAAPTKEGYTFSGWSEIPATMPAKDVTVSGTFTINKYKLTYKVDGESYQVYEIEYGSTIMPESEPSKDGYTFSGWSEIPTTMPAHDVEVTGTFTQVEFVIDNVTYEITGEGTVTVNGCDQKGEVTIEPTVEINGQTYRVTAIADDAFKNNQDITSLTIPEGITTIGGNAFEGCTGLIVINIGKDVKTIGNKAFANIGTASVRTRSEESLLIVNCYAESVPYTASDAFENTPIDTGTLYVVDELKETYKATSPWSRFGKIIGFEESTGIKAITTGAGNAFIFDMQGNRLDNVRKGVNIIRTRDGKTKKVILK
jgi:surface protein